MGDFPGSFAHPANFLLAFLHNDDPELLPRLEHYAFEYRVAGRASALLRFPDASRSAEMDEMCCFLDGAFPVCVDRPDAYTSLMDFIAALCPISEHLVPDARICCFTR
jgi:hypothetical protein